MAKKKSVVKDVEELFKCTVPKVEKEKPVEVKPFDIEEYRKMKTGQTK